MNEKAVDKLVKLYTELETELMLAIASHFQLNEEFLNSDNWRFQKLSEMGLLNQDVIEIIARYSNKTPAEVLQAMEDVGYSTFNINDLKKAFKNGKINVDPQTLLDSMVVQTIIKNQYNELSDSLITMSNKIINSTIDEYLNIVDKTYLETAEGFKSYNQSIIDGIKELSSKGIKTMTYRTIDDNGIERLRNYSIEGMVRRETLTATHKLSNQINEEMIERLKCEYVHLSEHERCRPSHFSWQGTIVKADKWKEITHYGEMDGLGGPNCKHYVEPYFGDKRGKDLKHLTKEECEEAYKKSQHQRYLERGVRKWKRDAELMKTIGSEEEYRYSNKKVVEWQKRVSNYTKENNLQRDFEREFIGTK